MSAETFFVIHFANPFSIALCRCRKIISAENLVEHDFDVVAGVPAIGRVVGTRCCAPWLTGRSALPLTAAFLAMSGD
jgi:hypothetical protein